MPEADTGAPRFAQPIWVGRYELEPASGVTFDNATVMLSKQLMVQLTGDAENVTAGEVFATLPSECLPDHTIMLPVVVEGSGTRTVGATFETSGAAATATAEFSPSDPHVSATFEVSGSEGVPVSVTQGAATASATVPERTATGTATVPDTTGTGTATVPASKATGSIEVSRDVAPMVFVGYDESGVPDSAYSADLVNNTEGSVGFEADVPEASIPLSVTIPESSATVSVSVPETQLDVTVDLPTPTATVDVPPSQGTVEMEIPTMTGDVLIESGLSLSGTVEIEATSEIGILTVTPVGEMKCNMGGTVHLNGINFHLCSNYY